jgi:DNA-binding response OmpR family regulator/two-component sensor histidine kinase
MLRLVNQILDFRKIQNNKMKLCIEQIDIVPFTRKIMENFESVAESNKIDFIFESEQPSLKLWADADKVEKIIFNLLSNAFKYTEPGKAIKIFIHENENTIAIGVQDQGIGIPENMKESLFARFETLLDKNLFNYKNSTGIGLSLVKELADMHHASICVDSKEGEGSCFTIEFKKGKAHYGKEAEFILSDNIEHNTQAELADPAASEEGITEDRNTMLLVEDNLELRAFLRSIFKAQFQIIEASNGTEGIDKAKKHIPDIIISDIMMPGQDGIALTKELRHDVATSHIPIVLLTAKADMDSKLQGMELGIDSYITKPFSAIYLKARVDNLLARRQRLRQFYCEHLMDINDAGTEEEAKVEEEVQNSISPQDKLFIDRLTEFMEKHMDNGELVVDDLVHEMSVSRSVFFKKLKSLTGLAPIEFIKEMRVKRAAQLIETGEFNMTQIAYMVGINDPRYFSKCFKQRFGMTPTEYKEKVRK